jgi:hypothetical protein
MMFKCTCCGGLSDKDKAIKIVKSLYCRDCIKAVIDSANKARRVYH